MLPKKLISSSLISLLVFQTIIGIFIPMKISTTPPYLSHQNSLAAGEAWQAGYSYRKQITFTSDIAKIPATQTDFPVLISRTDTDLRTIANGGHVQSANGYDINFTSDNGSTVLSHEIEKYDATTGEYIAWVKVSSLTPSSIIYMYYGNSSIVANPSTTAVWDANTKGVWHLNGGTSGLIANNTTIGFEDSTTVNNSTAKNTNGTGMAWNSGKFNSGVSFDGIDDYVDAGTGSSLNITDTITIEMWIYGSSYPSGKSLLSRANYNSFGYDIYIGFTGLGNLCFRSHQAGAMQSQCSIGSVLTNNAWNHIAFTKSGSVGTWYINGIDKTAAYVALTNMTGGSRNLIIGKYDSGSANFAGSIDEVKIYSRSLTPQEVTTKYNNQNSPSTFYTVSVEQVYEVAITGSAAQTAGVAQVITITAKDSTGSTLTTYTGDKSVILSGANLSPNSTAPTCTDKDSVAIPFDSSTTLTFTNGVAACSLLLYETETAIITTNISDLVDTNLSVTVSPATVNNFLVDAPATAASGTAFSTTITSRDAYNNTTTAVSGSTTLSLDTGSVSPSSITQANFTDDGIYTGDLTISGITEESSVVLTATNGTPTGNDTLTVQGVAFAPTIGTPIVDSSTAITWHWTDNSAFEESFRLDFTTGSGTDVNGIASDSTSYQTADLTPNTQYAVHIHSYRADTGESAASADSTAVYTLANVPSGLSLTADSQTQITAFWSSNSNSASTEFYIENTTKGTNSGWITNLSWASANLSCSTAYSFRVKAKNGDGTSTAFTDPVIVTTNNCGGGLPPAAYNPPNIPAPSQDNPQVGFKVLINNNAIQTDSKIVALTFNAGSDVKRIAISEDSDFKNASQEEYSPIKQFVLSEGDGIKIIYVKFYTAYGVASEAVSDSIILKTIPAETAVDNPGSTGNEQINSGTGNTGLAPSTFSFTQTLQFGSNNNQVIELQNRLKQLNFFPQETASNGNFGPTTRQAVMEYQRSKGIYPSNGIVGPRTRKALNNQEFITNKDHQFTQDLKYNDKNEEVKQLQTRLRDQNFFPYNIPSTGWFGPITQKAVNLFRGFYNLIKNGVVDFEAREVLNK